MLEVIFALAPIFVLILIGYLIKQKGYVSDSFWEPAESLTYYVFFPALLFYTTARTNIGELSILPMAFALLCATVLISAIAIKARALLRCEDAQFTSFFQGLIRPNSYIAIAAAFSLWGEPGLTLIAIAIAFVVPTVNLLSVIVMETYGESEFRTDEGPKWKKLSLSIARNPLILACVGGTIANMSGASLPPVIEPLMNILGRAALPIGLLCVGAGLNIVAMKDVGRLVGLASVCKLVVLPVLCLLCCLAFGVEGITRDLSVLYAGMPVSASSYVLARKMGGEPDMMAGIITLTTLCAMMTLPVLLILVSWL